MRLSGRTVIVTGGAAGIGQHMPYITAPEESQLAAGTRDQLALFADKHWHFSALRGVVARFPAALGALDNQYSLIIGGGRLDRWVREAAFASCSAERGDAYLANALAAETTLVRVIRTASSDPESVTPEDIDALRAAGWSDDEIVEALIMASHSAWTTTVAQALRLEDDLEAPEFAGYF